MTVIKSLKNRWILLKQTIKKVVGEEEFFLNFLGPLLWTGSPFMKSIITLLAKSILVPLGLTIASKTYAAIQKKIFGSGVQNEQIEYVIKVVKSLEESCLMIKGFSGTIKS